MRGNMGLRKDQYNRILREYDDRRQQNRWELDQRIRHACQQIPELEQIDQEIASGSIECARLMLAGNEDCLAQLKLRNEKLSERKKRLLTAAGFPEDYLKLRYHCPDMMVGSSTSCLIAPFLTYLSYSTRPSFLKAA